MMIFLLVLFLFVPAVPAVTEAACSGTSPNLTAASVNRADVVDCITAAVNDDIITIPSGTATDWTTEVTISKAITLRGSGTLATIIEDNTASSADQLIDVNLVAGKVFRLENIRFNGPGATVSSYLIHINANSDVDDGRRFVIQDCYFDHIASWVLVANRAWGVFARNTILRTNQLGAPIYLFHNGYTWADDRWADSNSHWGTDKFVIIEDNNFWRDNTACGGTCATKAMVDMQAGSTYVARYNDVKCGYFEVHGTESPGRQRGGRAVEIYENTFDSTGCNSSGNTILGLRSGSALVYNNTVSNWSNAVAAISFSNLRAFDNYTPWGIADGRNTWDNNDPGNPLVTATASSAGTLSVTDSGKSWTTNQWVGYIVRKTTSPCNVPITSSNATNEQFTTSVAHGLSTGNSVSIKSHTGSTPAVTGDYTVTVVDSTTFTVNTVALTVGGTGGYVSLRGAPNPECSSVISSNTATQLTFGSSQHTPDLTFAGGDTYEINKIDKVFDQGGVGGGTDLLGTTRPVVTANNQVVDPVYEWNNIKDGVTNLQCSVPSSYVTQIIANTHFFNDTTAPGYTAYTYPHPLVSGSPPSPGGNGGMEVQVPDSPAMFAVKK